MTVIREITIDILNSGLPPRVYAMQGDAKSRAVKINLKNNGQDWNVPEGATGIVRYSRANGNGSSYDTTPDGLACTFGESYIIVSLSQNLMIVSGLASVCVDIQSEGASLHTFVFELSVEKNPGIARGEDGGYYIAGTVKDSGWEPNKYLGTDENGRVIEKDPLASDGFGLLTVVLDLETETASHSSTEILDHLSVGGSVIAKIPGNGDFLDEYCHLWSAMDGEVGFSYIMVSSTETTQYLYTVRTDKSIGVGELTMEPGSGETVTEDPTVTAIAVTEAADGTVTMVNTLDSGSTETIVITPDASGNPGTLTYNGTAIPITWVVSE